ncbi:hypothetical protein V7793_04150, partial [Streptomyces sp. KLMMK]
RTPGRREPGAHRPGPHKPSTPPKAGPPAAPEVRPASRATHRPTQRRPTPQATHAPPQPPPSRHPSPSARPQRAPALAAVSLGLSVASLITLVLAAIAAIQAVEARVYTGLTLEQGVVRAEMMEPLILSLITAILALVVVSIARSSLGASAALATNYTEGPAHATGVLTRTAKIIAVPTLILAVLILLVYLVARGYA